MTKRVVGLVGVVFALALATQVRSASPSFGKIKVTTPGLVLELQDPTSRNKRVNIPANQEIPAPPGTYKTTKLTQYAQDTSTARPTTWSIMCRSQFGNVATVTVAAGETTEVSAGAPLVVRADAQVVKDKAKGTSVSIGLGVYGSAGESYATDSIMQGKRRVPTPSLKILDENGKEMASGTFEYG